jgi:hypothetical protein
MFTVEEKILESLGWAPLLVVYALSSLTCVGIASVLLCLQGAEAPHVHS